MVDKKAARRLRGRLFTIVDKWLDIVTSGVMFTTVNKKRRDLRGELGDSIRKLRAGKKLTQEHWPARPAYRVPCCGVW